MPYLILQIISLLIISLIIVVWARPRVLAFFLSAILAFFLSLQISSLYMGGSLIDYKYYLHTGAIDFGLMMEFFLWESLLMVVVFILLTALIFYLSRGLRKWKSRKWPFVITLLAGLVFMCFPKGVIYELNNIRSMVSVADRGIEEALTQLGIPPGAYVKPMEVVAKKGKNIIAISLESFEKGFLQGKLSDLTPNLQQLAKEQTFFSMLQNPGSDWTSASVYTSLTGFPAFFKGKPNDIFMDANSLQLTSIGHVLKTAGYDLTYLLGKKEFAGTDKMLSAFEFNVRSEKDFPGRYLYSSWGLHDKDLFTEAKKIVAEKQEAGKPFALFMSTISTHLPNGVHDKRMEKLIEEKGSGLEFMVAAVDYIIGDFIEELKVKGLLENTVFYIYPDHLIMGNSPFVLENFGELRELYLLTNADKKDLSYDPKDKIWQVNIPKIILEGAGVKHNMTFFCDFIPTETPVDEFISTHKKDIVAFNEAAMDTENFQDGITIEKLGADSLRLMSGEFKKVIVNQYKDPAKAHVFIFDERSRLVGEEVTTSYEAFQTRKFKKGNTYLILQMREENLYALLRKGDKISVAKKGVEKVSFDKNDFDVLQEWTFKGNEFRLPSQPNYQSPQDLIYLTSGVGGLGEINSPGEIRIGSQNLPIKKGINLLTKSDDEYTVFHYDLSEDVKNAMSLLANVKQLKAQKQFFAIVTQEWSTNLEQYTSEFEEAGLDLLTVLKAGEAYIAYAYQGYISEYKLHKPLSIQLPEYPKPSKRSLQQIEADAKNSNKFIAHAGGAIDHNNYTNSLDALNLSYAKGYRLFELDIIKTLDGHYVAAHDWNFWAKHVNHKKRTGVNRAEFLKYKKEGKYTPMGMEEINQWFTEHPDAILITDKVNEPQQFASEFVDKQRLMMELFTLEAVEEAVQEGIKVIPSEKVLDKIEGDKVSWLKQRGIGQVALSRMKFREKLPLFKELKANGIKVYVYHVSAEKGKDEAYVLLHDFDYVWGMYADEWVF